MMLSTTLRRLHVWDQHPIHDALLPKAGTQRVELKWYHLPSSPSYPLTKFLLPDLSSLCSAGLRFFTLEFYEWTQK